MADTHNRVELKLPGSYRLEPEEGYKFSLFPYAGEVTGLTERPGVLSVGQRDTHPR